MANRNKLETVACNLCGSSIHHNKGSIDIPLDRQYIFSVDRLGIVQCQQCGLVFTDPRPTLAVLGEFYDVDYSELDPVDIERKILDDRSLLCSDGGM